jgi:hypothetical protein
LSVVIGRNGRLERLVVGRILEGTNHGLSGKAMADRVAAGALFAFIWLVERHSRPATEVGEGLPRLLDLRPAEVTSIQLRRTNQFLLRGGPTSLNPISRSTIPPGFAIENLLDFQNDAQTRIHPKNGCPGVARPYGLDACGPLIATRRPPAGIALGSVTPGDQVYVLFTSLVIYQPARFDRLPRPERLAGPAGEPGQPGGGPLVRSPAQATPCT